MVANGDRITPAYAGKTCVLSFSFRSGKDHPRIRGKDSVMHSPLVCSQGSPPHTRERPVNTESVVSIHRITPAYAGKTAVSKMIIISPQDHPRIRGKDDTCTASCLSVVGSPPHTRERQLRSLIISTL